MGRLILSAKSAIEALMQALSSDQRSNWVHVGSGILYIFLIQFSIRPSMVVAGHP